MNETFTSVSQEEAGFRDRARLSFELDADICVIGAGLAGLSIALEAARLGASVAVLEGRHIGWNASGNQLGTVMPGFALPLTELIERIGFEDARELWTLSKEGAEFVRANATEANMPGIGPSDGVLEVSNVDAGDRLISRLQMLAEDFDTEVEGWQADRVRKVLKTDRYFHGVYYPRAFQVDGRKYVHGLAALARRAGARIFEDTPVVSIDHSGIRKRIVTPSARLRATHIVLAGNIHLGAPLRRLSETLLPVWRYAGITAPLGERVHEIIAFKGSVMDSDGVDHFRIVDGDRLMWESPETTWAARPQRFAGAVRRRVRSIFPQLGNVEITETFGGATGQTVPRHAADRPVAQRPVGGERVRPPGHEHLGHGRADDRAQHSVGRRALAAVLAVRAGLGGRRDRPRRGPDGRDLEQGELRCRRVARPLP
ncbi:glycine/D-amino acid oxidase-like deaminating enzyme [Bradyrhizobium sp. LB7.2]